MAEYIVKETAYPLVTRQEIVGELIRCKDCKHSHGCGYPHCNRVTFWNGEDDYCSRAERRTDGQTD